MKRTLIIWGNMIKDNKKISCLMSIYNGENYLEKSVESILNQTYDNFEFLIINDGSNDNTDTILKDLKAIDSRIKVFDNNVNLGLTKSLNKLIKNAEGDFVARQDVDDTSFPERFEKQIKYLSKNNIDACTTKAVGKQSQKILHNKTSFFPTKLVFKYKNPFIHGTLMVKTDVIRKIGMYNELFKFSQDYKLFYDLLSNGYKVEIFDECLYELNEKENISSIFKLEQAKYANKVRNDIKFKNIYFKK